MNLKKLSSPFPIDKVHWRIGNKSKKGDSATALAYINARDIMDRLDEVVGIDSWYDEYRVVGDTTICSLSIKVNVDEWITKEDGSGDTKIEAEKGALSKALVRAGVKWGIGRYLYDVETRYFKIDQWGKFLDTETSKMNALLGDNPPPIDKPVAPKVDTERQDYINRCKELKIDLFKTDNVDTWLEDNKYELDTLRDKYADLHLAFMGYVAEKRGKDND